MDLANQTFSKKKNKKTEVKYTTVAGSQRDSSPTQNPYA